MTEQGKKVWKELENMEWSNEPKDFHLEYFEDIIEATKKALTIPVVSNSFICVKDQEPPKNTELIAQDPKGGNYLTSWRESYKIFMCQNKQEDSSEWKWKQI